MNASIKDVAHVLSGLGWSRVNFCQLTTRDRTIDSEGVKDGMPSRILLNLQSTLTIKFHVAGRHDARLIALPDFAVSFFSETAQSEPLVSHKMW